MNGFINKLKLTISVPEPPRNAIASGGISLKSYGKGQEDYPDHQASGSVEERDWTCGLGAIPALTCHPESFFESFIVPVQQADGSEVDIVFEPPAAKITSKYGIPHSSC